MYKRQGEGGALKSTGLRRHTKIKNGFCFKLDAESVPEALATTIRILLMFSIVLAHRCNPGVWPHPVASGMPHRHPIGTSLAPPIGTPTDPTLAICPSSLRPPDQNRSKNSQNLPWGCPVGTKGASEVPGRAKGHPGAPPALDHAGFYSWGTRSCWILFVGSKTSRIDRTPPL